MANPGLYSFKAHLYKQLFILSFSLNPIENLWWVISTILLTKAEPKYLTLIVILFHNFKFNEVRDGDRFVC